MVRDAHGRMASNSGCTEVVVDACEGRRKTCARPSESAIKLECTQGWRPNPFPSSDADSVSRICAWLPLSHPPPPISEADAAELSSSELAHTEELFTGRGRTPRACDQAERYPPHWYTPLPRACSCRTMQAPASASLNRHARRQGPTRIGDTDPCRSRRCRASARPRRRSRARGRFANKVVNQARRDGAGIQPLRLLKRK